MNRSSVMENAAGITDGAAFSIKHERMRSGNQQGKMLENSRRNKVEAQNVVEEALKQSA